MKHRKLLALLLAVCMVLSLLPAIAVAEEKSDVLNNANTVGQTTNNYSEWTFEGDSGAAYSGQSAGGNGSIQLRSSNSNSGIVTTKSGGKVTKVTIAWNDNTTNGRTLDVYGKNSAYTKPTDLYSSSTQGTKLGSIVKGTSTELTISGDYAYIGMRSNNGAMYIDSIEIVWEASGETPPAETYTVYLDPGVASGERVTVENVTSPYTLPACPFTAPEGKTFAGWVIDGDENEIIYSVGQSVTVSEGTVFIAQWKNAPQYTNMMLKRVPADGDTVVIYYPAASKVMTAEDYYYNDTKHELVMIDATLTDNVLAVPDEAVRLTVSVADGKYTFTAADGKYLEADGTHVQFVSEQSANTLFQLETAAAGTDNYYIKCDSATYNNNAQYLDYYSGYITVRSINSSTQYYTFQFFSEDGEGPSPTETFTVTFDMDGGSGSFDLTQSVASGAEITLPAKADVTAPEGKGFAGWLSSADNEVHAGGSKVTITGDTTFTAQWKNVYTVYLKADENAEPVVYEENVTGTQLPAADYFEAPEGKVFAGWKSSVDGTVYEAGAVISEITADITFTAQWEDKPVVPTGEKTFVKVTEAPEDWSGEYLIVYEDGALVFDSSLETLDAGKNGVSVEIDGNAITTDIRYAFTIAAVDGGYSIKSSSGKYIGQSSFDNKLSANATYTDSLLNTISLDEDGNAVISGTGASGDTHVTLRYNKNSGDSNQRFRYYKSGQQPIALYKLETLEDGFYLIGSVNGWSVDNLNAKYKFAQNETNSAEYILKTTLEEGDQFKVVRVENGAVNPESGWYPGGDTPNYTVTGELAGKAVVYFRPDYSGGNDWFYNTIYVAKQYKITCISGENGVVSTENEYESPATTVTVAVDPGEGYELDTLTVMCGETAVETTKVNDEQYTFRMPAGDVTVTATFKEIVPAFKSHSLVLEGQIGVNFYMELPEIEGCNYADSYMTFTIEHGTCTERDNYDAGHHNDKGYYGFTCYVSAIQMAETITATFHYTVNGEEKTLAPETYSVKQYFEFYDTHKNSFNEKEQKLIEALADYGHYAQIFLAASNDWTIGTDYANMNIVYTNSYDFATVQNGVASYAIKRTKADDMDKMSFSLIMDSDTEIRMFFKPVDGYEGDVTVTVNGEAWTATKVGERYQVSIKNIAAHQLGNEYQIVVTTADDTTVTVYALSYAQITLSASASTDAAKNAMAALYYYSEAAKAYNN